MYRLWVFSVLHFAISMYIARTPSICVYACANEYVISYGSVAKALVLSFCNEMNIYLHLHCLSLYMYVRIRIHMHMYVDVAINTIVQCASPSPMYIAI